MVSSFSCSTSLCFDMCYTPPCHCQLGLLLSITLPPQRNRKSIGVAFFQSVNMPGTPYLMVMLPLGGAMMEMQSSRSSQTPRRPRPLILFQSCLNGLTGSTLPVMKYLMTIVCYYSFQWEM